MSPVFTDHLISWTIAVPFIGLALLAFVRSQEWIRRIALAITSLAFALAVVLWSLFDASQPGMQFVERSEWMPTFNIHYAVGIDGISLLLVLLTTFLAPICVLASWKSIDTR